VFGGPRSSGVCLLDGTELKCVDLFTGQLRWIRNQIPNPSMIKEGGDHVTIWADNHHQIYETFDKLSGRRIRGGKILKLRGPTSTGYNHYHLFQIPMRSKSSVDSRQKKTPNDPFAEQAYTDLKLQMYDFELGEVAWERTFPFPSVFRQVDQTSIAVLTRDGILSLLDLATGKVRFEKQIEGLSDVSCLQLSVTPLAQGYVCTVNTSEGAVSKIEPDENTEIRFGRVKSRGWLNTGYIFAVERETGESLWSKPVRVESFGVLDGTPYNSPFLTLIRRANYRSLARGVSRAVGNNPRIQIAMLDVATGQLKLNHLLKEAIVGNEPRCQIVCRPGKEYQSDKEEIDDEDGQNQRIELLIASQRYSIQLTESDEDAADPAPAVLSSKTSAMKLEDDLDNIAEGEGANLVVDLAPVAQRAKEANEAMLELGKFESELFEKQRKARQQQR